MVRDERIKEYRFSLTGIDTATTGSQVSHSINGEVLEVNWAWNRTGSVFLSVGDTGEEFFRRNAPSGTGTQVTRPQAYVHAATGGLVSAGSPVQSFVLHSPVVLNYAGLASGTSALGVTFRYR